MRQHRHSHQHLADRPQNNRSDKFARWLVRYSQAHKCSPLFTGWSPYVSRLLIHIGTHKTGTTYLQNALASNRDKLQHVGVIYPEVTPHPNHHGLIAHWNHLHADYVPLGGALTAWRDIVDDFSSGDKDVLLSSEEFSRTGAQRPDFRKILTMVEQFDEVRLICFVRNQVDYLQSIYLENSKVASPPPAPEFVSSCLAADRVYGVSLDYSALITTLTEQIPETPIDFHDYTTACESPDGLLGYFLQTIRCTLKASELRDPACGDANISPEPLSVWAANIVSTPGVAPTSLRALARDSLVKCFGSSRGTTLFTRGECKTILEHFDPLNAVFIDNVRRSQPEFDISPPRDLFEAVHRDDVSVDYWVDFARRLYSSPKVNSR